MKKYNPFLMEGFAVEGFCRDDSYYVRFTDEDIDELSAYAFDLGYALEPEVINNDPGHPMRFKESVRAILQFTAGSARLSRKKMISGRMHFYTDFTAMGNLGINIRSPLTCKAIRCVAF